MYGLGEMGTVKDYHRYAARCLQEARAAPDSDSRSFLVEMAQAWRSSLNTRSPPTSVNQKFRKQIEAIRAASVGMADLSDDERNLLRHYAEAERVISGPERTATYQHLLSRGYIEERPVNLQDLMIVVTEAGRTALSSRAT